MTQSGRIAVGIGGWTYAPWRETFYPKGVRQKDELAYAAGQLTAIEINGTFYRTQKPETFASWRSAVPEGFVFALKAPRYATNRKVLGEAGESVQRFIDSGIVELGDALGPILWQFATTKRFEPDDFAAFLALLPHEVEGMRLRHAVEVRHDSFKDPEAVALARAHDAAIVLALDSPHPVIADLCADFAYLRLMGTQESEPAGYGAEALDAYAAMLQRLAAGGAPGEPAPLAAPAASTPRDVYCFVIGGHKAHNPRAAMSLIERLG